MACRECRDWKRECEWQLFSFGKLVLGKASGGLINRLWQAKGIRQAWVLIRQAQEKEDPLEWIGAVLKQRQDSPELDEAERDRLIAQYREKQARNG